jgi:hypothetical protein
MFHSKRPIFKVFGIIPSCYCCCSWGYPYVGGLVLGASKLLAMAKDTNGLHLITKGEVFL